MKLSTVTKINHSVRLLGGLMLTMLLGRADIILAAEDTWASKTDMPTATSLHSSCVVDGKIYIFGGTDTIYRWNTDYFSTVLMYDPATKSWTSKADMTGGRARLTTNLVDGKIYAIGGCTRASTEVSTVEMYDPAPDTWTRKADIPTLRGCHSAIVADGKIYVIGGVVTVSLSPQIWVSIPTVEAYDTGIRTPSPDSNGEGIVDAADMCMMIDYWGTDEPLYDIAPPPFGDGVVDVQDLIVLAEHLFDGAGLVAHWALDETEGDIAYDSASYIDAAVHNGQWTAGKVGSALLFNGLTTYMDCGDSLRLGTQKMTLAMWLEPQHMGGMRYILSRANVRSGVIDYALMRHLDGEVEFAVGQGDSDPVSVLLNATTPLDEWTHVAVFLNGSEVTIYVNGLPDASALYTERVSRDEGYRLMISSLGGNTRFYNGKIDEVRVYNIALSVKEIEELMQ